MVDIKRVNIVETDDWVWLFIDDKLFNQGHSISSFSGGNELYLLKLSEENGFSSKDVDRFYFEENENLASDISSLSFSEVIIKYEKDLEKIDSNDK